MMLPWIALTITIYTLLVIIWVKGLGAVQKYQPDKAVTFYFIMAAIRFTVALTVVALYMLLSTHTREEAMVFCLAFSLMYVAMVIISIMLKH